VRVLDLENKFQDKPKEEIIFKKVCPVTIFAVNLIDKLIILVK
jgi:hypothetical protein